MKLKPSVEKIGRNGEIKIPGDYLKVLGLCPGAEVELKLEDGHLLVKPAKPRYKGKRSPVDELTGLIPVEDPDLIDELLASEDLYG